VRFKESVNNGGGSIVNTNGGGGHVNTNGGGSIVNKPTPSRYSSPAYSTARLITTQISTTFGNVS
jgi:hypothetical protein